MTTETILNVVDFGLLVVALILLEIAISKGRTTHRKWTRATMWCRRIRLYGDFWFEKYAELMMTEAYLRIHAAAQTKELDALKRENAQLWMALKRSEAQGNAKAV